MEYGLKTSRDGYVKRPDGPLVLNGYAALLDSPLTKPELVARVRELLGAYEPNLFRVVARSGATLDAPEIMRSGSGVEPTEFFLRLVAATVANDGDFIGVLEHELSPKPEAKSTPSAPDQNQPQKTD